MSDATVAAMMALARDADAIAAECDLLHWRCAQIEAAQRRADHRIDLITGTVDRISRRAARRMPPTAMNRGQSR